MKEERNDKFDDPAMLPERLEHYPSRLITALLRVAEARGLAFFVVGGTVRDWLLGRTPGDLDITVAHDAVTCCRSLIAELGGGTFVPLGCIEEDAGRVGWQGLMAKDGLMPREPGMAGAAFSGSSSRNLTGVWAWNSRVPIIWMSLIIAWRPLAAWRRSWLLLNVFIPSSQQR
jgi:hypothetical protein